MYDCETLATTKDPCDRIDAFDTWVLLSTYLLTYKDSVRSSHIYCGSHSSVRVSSSVQYGNGALPKIFL